MGVSFSFLWVTSRGEARECAGRPLLGTPCGTAPGIRFYRCAYIAPHPPGVTLIPRRPTLRGRGPVIGDLQRLVSRRVQGVQRGTLVLAHARLAKACRDWRRQVVELQGGIAPGPPQARTRGAVKQPSLRLAPGRIAASGAAGWRRCASHRAARKGGGQENGVGMARAWRASPPRRETVQRAPACDGFCQPAGGCHERAQPMKSCNGMGRAMQ